MENERFKTIVQMAQDHSEEELIESLKDSLGEGKLMIKSLELILAIHFQKIMEMKSMLVKAEIVLNKVEVLADEIIELRKHI